MDAKKPKVQPLLYQKEETSPLYSLPDEVLQNCLSYIGKGHYGLVAPVSKKLCRHYKEEFGNETAYLEMATSVNLANHCINKLCKSSDEIDELFKAAAVNGNLDILRYADLNGYDLFPLVEMDYKSCYDEYDRYTGIDEYFAEENEQEYSSQNKVMSFKLVERGHLHVLRYLHEELHYFFGLQRYCKPAIEYGKLEIMKWLKKIGCMDNAPLNIDSDFCKHAIQCGNVESLQWLLQNGYEIKGSKHAVLPDAISSKSLEMIQYCFNLGYDDLQPVLVKDAIKKTKSVAVLSLMNRLGYDFRRIKDWCNTFRLGDNFDEYFDIIKFLRGISTPWDPVTMKMIVAHGNVKMIQYAYEDGCPWTTSGEEFNAVLCNYVSMLSQDFKDAELGSEYAYFLIFCTSLKSLIDHGYTFRSQAESY